MLLLRRGAGAPRSCALTRPVTPTGICRRYAAGVAPGQRKEDPMLFAIAPQPHSLHSRGAVRLRSDSGRTAPRLFRSPALRRISLSREIKLR